MSREESSAIVWFLDGHYSGGETGRGGCDVPLLLELRHFPYHTIGKMQHDAVSLRAIAAAQRIHGDVIVIDDHRLFGTQDAEDWVCFLHS